MNLFFKNHFLAIRLFRPFFPIKKNKIAIKTFSNLQRYWQLISPAKFKKKKNDDDFEKKLKIEIKKFQIKNIKKPNKINKIKKKILEKIKSIHHKT